MKEVIKHIKNFFKKLFAKKPEKIAFIYPYSEIWDKKLNALMEKYTFTKGDGYTTKLGDVVIWIANHPYASFRPREIECSPSSDTARRAFEKYINDTME